MDELAMLDFWGLFVVGLRAWGCGLGMLGPIGQ